MNPREELHCPNPRCTDSIEPGPVRITGNMYQVRCPCCGMTGPQVGGKAAAVKAWKRIQFAADAA